MKYSRKIENFCRPSWKMDRSPNYVRFAVWQPELERYCRANKALISHCPDQQTFICALVWIARRPKWFLIFWFFTLLYHSRSELCLPAQTSYRSYIWMRCSTISMRGIRALCSSSRIKAHSVRNNTELWVLTVRRRQMRYMPYLNLKWIENK